MAESLFARHLVVLPLTPQISQLLPREMRLSRLERPNVWEPCRLLQVLEVSLQAILLSLLAVRQKMMVAA